MTWMIWRYSPWLRKPSSSFWVNCMGSGLVWTCHSSCRWSSQNMWIDISLNVRGFSALGLGASKLQSPDFSHRTGSILVDLGVGSQEVFEKSSRPKIIPKKQGQIWGNPSVHQISKTHLKAPVRHRGQPCKAKVDGEDGAYSTHTSAIPWILFTSLRYLLRSIERWHSWGLTSTITTKLL